MIAFLGKILGSLLRNVFDFVSSTISIEPESISYYAIAILITTIIFKLALLPLNLQQTKSARKMTEVQPLMQEIQNKYKKDSAKMQEKMQELYKEHKYNPFSGCLILIVQMPIIFAFFTVFREPQLYAFSDPGLYEGMAKNFLWITNLENPDALLWGLPLLAAATTFLQSKTMNTGTTDPQAQSTQKIMNYMLPLMIFWAARSFPAGLALYWVVSNTFTIVQQVITNKYFTKTKEAK